MTTANIEEAAASEAPATDTGPRRKSRTARALIVTCIILVCAAVVEAGVRIGLGKRQIAPRIYREQPGLPGFDLAPDASCYGLQSGRFAQITIDPTGHRLVVNAPDDPRAQVVDLVGDSQVFGQGLSDSESFASRMQENLGRSCRIVNHGVPGYGPFAYAKELQAIPREHWVIVIQTETNDLQDCYTAKTGNIPRCGYLAPDTWEGHNIPCWMLRLRVFQIGSLMINAMIANKRPLPANFNPHSVAASETLLYRNHELFRKEKEARAGRVLFTYVPWAGAWDKSKLKYYVPEITDPVRSVKLPDDFDIEAPFTQDEKPESLFLPSDDHLSPRGAELMGKALAEKFRKIAAVP